MAAYRADIEIGVKGIQEIGVLQKKLEGTIYKINDLNSKSVKAFGGVAQSIQNYNKQLFLAEKALYRVAAGSTQEARAVSNYVTALGNANAIRSRQNKLIQDEIRLREELDRKNRLAAAGIRETTQYGAPAMPGRANTIEQARVEAIKRLGAERRILMQLADREAATEAKINEILAKRTAIQKRNKADKEGLSNALVGGAFPLLFGQGIGASLGGGLGGFAGGRMGGQLGFGLSLAGTALGGLFDQATKSAADFSKSLRAGGDAAGYLEQQLGSIDPQVRDQIKNLQSSGQTARAAELAFNELANQIGVENARAFRELGDDTNKFTSGFQRLVTTIIAGSARIDEAIKPITDRLGRLSLAIPGVNAAALTRGAIDFVRGQGRAPSTQQEKTPEALQRETVLKNEVSLLQQRVQLTTVSAQGDLQLFVNVSKRVALQENAIALQKIDNEVKRGALSLEEARLQKSVANLQLQQSLGEIERQRIQEERRRADEARRASEQAAQERLQAFTASIQLENDIRNIALERANVQVEIDRLTKGETAALAEQMRISEGTFALKLQILANERQSALANNKNTNDAALINELYKQRAALLQAQQYLDQQRLIRLNNELKLEQQLNNLRRADQREQALQPVRRAQEQAQLGIESFFQTPNAAERLRTESEQRQRLYDAELPILNEILRLNTEIASGAYVGTALQQKQLDLENQQTTLTVLREELLLLDQLELKQLKLKQTFQDYGVVINGVSNAIADAMTTGVSSIVTGTQNAQQVFAAFLETIAQTLLQAASQMIATYIAVGIARAFAFGGSSTPKSPTAEGGDLWGGVGRAIGPARAAGGPVLSGMPYLVGENGPELFVPGRTGNIVRADQTEALMASRAALNSGGSTSADVFTANREAMSASASLSRERYVERVLTSGASATEIKYSRVGSGDLPFVTEADMLQATRLAAQEGARLGQQRTIAALRNNPGTRRAIGV